MPMMIEMILMSILNVIQAGSRCYSYLPLAAAFCFS